MTIPDLDFSNLFSKLIETKNISTTDIVDMLKAVAVLVINIFLIIINTVAGILRALLPFFQ